MYITVETNITASDSILEQLIDMKRDFGFSSFQVEYNGGQSTISFESSKFIDLEELADDLGLPHHAISE